jgi:DNA-binding winged helix-turn-helix (wHTH) protein
MPASAEITATNTRYVALAVVCTTRTPLRAGPGAAMSKDSDNGSRPAGDVFRFGVFELDTHAVELRKRGIKVRLQGKPLQLLEALLERPGEVVTRDELQRRLWPSDVFVDFESGLNTAANRLRIALGDSAESPRYIETLARVGYRFIAPVDRVPSVAAARPADLPRSP